MKKTDYLGNGRAIKLLGGEIEMPITPKESLKEEALKLLLKKGKRSSDKPLKLKTDLVIRLKEEGEFLKFINNFFKRSPREKVNFLLAKDTLEEGCFGLIESWYADRPRHKWQRIIFIGENLVGDFFDIELNIPMLSIVQQLKTVGDETTISSTAGTELHHKLLAVI